MIKKFLCLTALWFLASPAQAGVLSSLLSFNGIQDIIEDDSVGTILDKSTIGVLESGDVLQGLIAFRTVDTLAIPNGSSIGAIYSFEVVSATPSTVTVTPATGADSVGTLLSTAGVNLNGLDVIGAGYAIFESTMVDLAAGTDFTSPIASPGVLGGLAGNLFDVVLTAGFDGIDDSQVLTATSIGALPGDLTNLARLNTFAGTGATFANFSASYSIIDTNFAAPSAFLEIFNPILNNFGQMTITNGLLTFSDTFGLPLGWDFQDDGDYRVNAVPEPASLATFAGMTMLGGFMARRRRRKSAAN